MEAQSFLEQPASTDILSAYRQVRFVVLSDTAYDPNLLMYADVYVQYSVSGTPQYVYLKTLQNNATFTTTYNGVFLFDIQDVLQEFLSTYLGFSLGSGSIINSYTYPGGGFYLPFSFTSSVKVIVKFRGSSITNGLLSNGLGANYPLIPIQATSSTLPTRGGINNGGYDIICNPFTVINASVTPKFGNSIFDNILASLLQSQRINAYGGVINSSHIYPLSNLPKNTSLALLPCLTIYKNTNGYFPIYFDSIASGTHFKVRLLTTDGTSVYYTDLMTADVVLVAKQPYYLPLGLGLIKQMLNTVYGSDTIFNSLTNPNNIENTRFAIALYCTDTSSNVFVTPLFKFGTTLIEQTTLWFQNLYGQFEQITFARSSEKFITTSSNQFKTYDQPLSEDVSYLIPGHSRYNVRANDEIHLMGVFDESLMQWIKELYSSPKILMETVTSSGNPILQAVMIADDTFVTKKSVVEGRINYEVAFKIRPQVDYIQLRN